jgi:hypothetical protein
MATGIWKSHLVLLIFINGVTVSKAPIDAPIPISKYGATQGVGSLICVFPQNKKAFDVTLFSGAAVIPVLLLILLK